jgi:hypothetical protein
MGAPARRFTGWQQIVGERAFGAIIGNSVPVPMIEMVIRSTLRGMGIDVGPNRWEHAADVDLT